MKLFFYLLTGCLLLISGPAFAAVQADTIHIDIERQLVVSADHPLHLVDSGESRETREGDILDSLGESTGEKGAEKKCMMVCEKWGEDCVINPRTGSRKCRRVCKQLAQQCF